MRNNVRIIGGIYRGRRLKVLDSPGLRPTPDRVRETVFNWLSPHIVGSRVLDLFAGSGAFGFEALSRGAKAVDMIDQSPAVVTLLKQELLKIAKDTALLVEIIQAQLPNYLKQVAVKEPYHIVFVDPPYQQPLILPCCFLLEEKNFLAANAHIYLEASALIKDNDLPANWRIVKSKHAGQVYYHLAFRE